MTKGPPFVIYILDKSEQTTGKPAKQKVQKVDHRLKRNQYKSLPINASLITPFREKEQIKIK